MVVQLKKNMYVTHIHSYKLINFAPTHFKWCTTIEIKVRVHLGSPNHIIWLVMTKIHILIAAFPYKLSSKLRTQFKG